MVQFKCFPIPGFVQQNMPRSFRRRNWKPLMLDAHTKKPSLIAQDNLLALEAELEKEHCRQFWNESWTKTSINEFVLVLCTV